MDANATYYMYHYDDKGNVSFVGEFVADAQGNLKVDIEKFSGNVLTKVEVELASDTDVESPQSGVLAESASAKSSMGIVAGFTALVAGAILAVRKFISRK